MAVSNILGGASVSVHFLAACPFFFRDQQFNYVFAVLLPFSSFL